MSASEIVDELLSLAFKKKPTNADKIRAGILRDVWEMMFGKPPQAVLVAGGLAGGDYSGGNGATSGLTVLLQRARYENERQAAKQMAKEPDPAFAAVASSPLTAGANAPSETTPETLNALQPSWTFLPGPGPKIGYVCSPARQSTPP